MTKNIYIFREYTSSKLSYFTNWTSTTNCIVHFSDILFGLKYALNRIYTGLAGYGLTTFTYPENSPALFSFTVSADRPLGSERQLHPFISKGTLFICIYVLIHVVYMYVTCVSERSKLTWFGKIFCVIWFSTRLTGLSLIMFIALMFLDASYRFVPRVSIICEIFQGFGDISHFFHKNIISLSYYVWTLWSKHVGVAKQLSSSYYYYYLS